MTKNNIKTILFASLIVALILPFSAMSLADAATNENATDKTSKELRADLDIRLQSLESSLMILLN